MFYRDLSSSCVQPQNSSTRQERASYLEYQKLMREIEHLSRLYVAWQFVCAEETKLKSAEDLQLMQSSISELQISMQKNADRIRELSDEIKVLEKSRDKVTHLFIGDMFLVFDYLAWLSYKSRCKL